VYLVDGWNVEEELVASIFQMDYCYSSGLRCGQQDLPKLWHPSAKIRALNLTKAEYEV